eukprot:TRINITY_DN15423_c0_g1_i1.p1 TRINITY_DN15423_c0_g1~~TRINITY_DN15423_c0_g1_i1.p1  ORF type:complete len:195 (-),score=58.88 TRINITY_DN15423_c0_g1_i1:296-880(-)
MEDSSSPDSSSSGVSRPAAQESRTLDVNGISLIQIMDSMEDQISKMDSRLSSLEDEDTRADLLSQFERVKGFMLLFQQKAITEITGQDRALKESRKREANWKDLSDLFSEYKNKASEEMASLKQMLESYRDMKNELQESNAALKQENLQLMEDNAVIKDVLIRSKAIATRRANLSKLLQALDDDEKELWSLGEK